MAGKKLLIAAGCAALLTCASAPALGAGEPQPGSPGYLERDLQNMRDAYGRQTAPDGQLTPKYIEAQNPNANRYLLEQLAEQGEHPNRPVLTPGQYFPGWNQGNPYRMQWPGRRGIEIKVAFTNRFGALLRGHVWAPLPGARDPYTNRKLRPPYPLAVITTGSVQGSERMYTWLAHDLAERGYIVLTYDVQGQGTSETLPHQGPLGDDWAWCDFTAQPEPGESSSCPGVPSQQGANFVKGTEDAIDFALSTPKRPYRNRHAGSAQVHDFNPLWKRIDRRRYRNSEAPGRKRKRLAIIGHSLGAAAISEVQGTDRRVSAAVALDKLSAGDGFLGTASKPKVPALGVQSEYGFNVVPYWLMGNSIRPSFVSPSEGPDPQREQATGFDGWREAGVETMMIVPRASTHLEYTDISWALPASRYGQALTSHYVQGWLDKYLKGRRGADRRLRAKTIRYLEPVGEGIWEPVKLRRNRSLSFYFCSGWDFESERGKRRRNLDVNGVGCD